MILNEDFILSNVSALENDLQNKIQKENSILYKLNNKMNTLITQIKPELDNIKNEVESSSIIDTKNQGIISNPKKFLEFIIAYYFEMAEQQKIGCDCSISTTLKYKYGMSINIMIDFLKNPKNIQINSMNDISIEYLQDNEFFIDIFVQ